MTYVIQFLGRSKINLGVEQSTNSVFNIDKLSLNYASAYSLIPDLGLEGQRYSWVAAIFNFGYLFWAVVRTLEEDLTQMSEI